MPGRSPRNRCRHLRTERSQFQLTGNGASEGRPVAPPHIEDPPAPTDLGGSRHRGLPDHEPHLHLASQAHGAEDSAASYVGHVARERAMYRHGPRGLFLFVGRASYVSPGRSPRGRPVTAAGPWGPAGGRADLAIRATDGDPRSDARWAGSVRSGAGGGTASWPAEATEKRGGGGRVPRRGGR
jgi:hypothetical protein